MSLHKALLAASCAATALSGAAAANDYYVSLSGGVSLLSDSENDGQFDGAFTTGAGTNILAGTVLDDGTSVGWNTEFDTGFAISGALGRRFDFFRAELEVAYQANDVDTHSGVTVADAIGLDGEDAGVLITGSDNLGVTVGDLVADGQGQVDTIFVMANVYYDFDFGGRIKPYVGAGAGVGFVDVDYSPSATPIIQDDATAFAYQAMAGVTYEVGPATELFAGYRYRATTDVEVNAALFPAEFDIENSGSIVEAGLRFTF